MKTCTKCDVSKDESEFHKRSDNRNLSGVCRACKNGYAKAYRDAKRQRGEASMSELDRFVIEEAVALRDIRSEMFGGYWHVDHIEPLQGTDVSGLHNAFNIAVVPAAYNMSKKNKQASAPWYMEC